MGGVSAYRFWYFFPVERGFNIWFPRVRRYPHSLRQAVDSNMDFRMKIVWITVCNPLSRGSGREIYSDGLVNSLRLHGADVAVYGYYYYKDREAYRATREAGVCLVQKRNIQGIWSLLSSLPRQAYQLRCAVMTELVRQAITPDVDGVVFDSMPIAWLLPVALEKFRVLGRRRPVIIYVSHNHEKSLQRDVVQAGNPLIRPVLRANAWKAAVLEKRLVFAADIVTAITDEDRVRFEADAPGKIHVTLPAGYGDAPDLGEDICMATPRRVAMIGSLSWLAKRNGLQRFIAAAAPCFSAANVELVVIGAADPGFVQNLAQYSSICRFVGYIENPRALLRSARIGMMVDEIGGGFKLKYLTYIFNGMPVATIRSQAVGLPFDIDEGMIVGHNARDLAEKVTAAIDDVPYLNRLRHFAFASCQGHFDWSSRGATLLDAIAKAKNLPRDRELPMRKNSS